MSHKVRLLSGHNQDIVQLSPDPFPLLEGGVWAGDYDLVLHPVIVGEPEPTRQQAPWTKTRIPSYRLRELSMGTFLVENEKIVLLNCIGEGVLFLDNNGKH